MVHLSDIGEEIVLGDEPLGDQPVSDGNEVSDRENRRAVHEGASHAEHMDPAHLLELEIPEEPMHPESGEGAVDPASRRETHRGVASEIQATPRERREVAQARRRTQPTVPSARQHRECRLSVGVAIPPGKHADTSWTVDHAAAQSTGETLGPREGHTVETLGQGCVGHIRSITESEATLRDSSTAPTHRQDLLRQTP